MGKLNYFHIAYIMFFLVKKLNKKIFLHQNIYDEIYNNFWI